MVSILYPSMIQVVLWQEIVTKVTTEVEYPHVLAEHVRQPLEERCGLMRALYHAVSLVHLLVDDVDQVGVARSRRSLGGWSVLGSGGVTSHDW